MTESNSSDFNLLTRYFPELTEKQLIQLNQLLPVYSFWNDQINVISRKDMSNFYERHVLHSLGIAKIQPFLPSSRVLDIGTGGGFPGIPLAILFPETQFTLVDSIGKKIKVVQAVADELGLTNVTAIHERAEKIKGKFDFIVSRAVTQMPDFLKWTHTKFASKSIHTLPNGVLYLKGGDLTEELSAVKRPTRQFELHPIFTTDFFETKKVVYVNMTGN
jgi:16S rRNA (guanine527-N7)-methyltransferase